MYAHSPKDKIFGSVIINKWLNLDGWWRRSWCFFVFILLSDSYNNLLKGALKVYIKVMLVMPLGMDGAPAFLACPFFSSWLLRTLSPFSTSAENVITELSYSSKLVLALLIKDLQRQFCIYLSTTVTLTLSTSLLGSQLATTWARTSHRKLKINPRKVQVSRKLECGTCRLVVTPQKSTCYSSKTRRWPYILSS